MTSINRSGGVPLRHPRPMSAFLPSDGEPATVAEALCLLMQSMLPLVKSETKADGPPSQGGQTVTGRDIIVGVREMLSSPENRSLLIMAALPGIQPSLRRALMSAGYARHMMMRDDSPRGGSSRDRLRSQLEDRTTARTAQCRRLRSMRRQARVLQLRGGHPMEPKQLTSVQAKSEGREAEAESQTMNGGLSIFNTTYAAGLGDVAVTWNGSDGMVTAIVRPGHQITITDKRDERDPIEVRLATGGDRDWSERGPSGPDFWIEVEVTAE